MLTSVPKLTGVSDSMYMPPTLMSFARPKMLAPPLTSHVTSALRGDSGMTSLVVHGCLGSG